MLVKYLIHASTSELTCSNVAISECHSVSYSKENKKASRIRKRINKTPKNI